MLHPKRHLVGGIFKGSLANTSGCSFQESPSHPLAALQVLGPQLCQGFAKPGLADNRG